MYAIHSMHVDVNEDVYNLGEIKTFQTREEAVEERKLMIKEINEDYDLDFQIEDENLDGCVINYQGGFFQINMQKI
ncbi:MAG: hypothetical protein IKP65_08825 [Alphaproteobacteria bacterium]|nr:hypothetical protein [Alphaproteobacteria bacterium]